jgi:hypothetical protein
MLDVAIGDQDVTFGQDAEMHRFRKPLRQSLRVHEGSPGGANLGFVPVKGKAHGQTGDSASKRSM